MELNQDFKEFFQSLNANGVRYLVVGGFAVALHGHPRYTKDIDVWIDCTAANAKRMVRAINPDVDVLRVARVSMQSHRESANHEISHVVSV